MKTTITLGEKEIRQAIVVWLVGRGHRVDNIRIGVDWRLDRYDHRVGFLVTAVVEVSPVPTSAIWDHGAKE